MLRVKKFSKCSENGIACLRKGNCSDDKDEDRKIS